MDRGPLEKEATQKIKEAIVRNSRPRRDRRSYTGRVSPLPPAKEAISSESLAGSSAPSLAVPLVAPSLSIADGESPLTNDGPSPFEGLISPASLTGFEYGGTSLLSQFALTGSPLLEMGNVTWMSSLNH